MTIWLVRHGETPGNVARVLQRPDTPLSEGGVTQARRVAERLASERVAEILTSDYARARMTAAPIARATGAPLRVDPLLRERDFGELRGRAYAELGFDPFAPDYHPPGGESWEEFHQRVEEAWTRVRERVAVVDGDLVVVTHGLVCHSLATRVLDTSRVALDGVALRNASVTRIEHDAPWTVRLFACTRHLDAESEGGGGARGRRAR